MWLSRKFAARTQYAECGDVTSAGSDAVFTDAERRGVYVCSPAGYVWRPKTGDRLVIIKTADGERMALGTIDDGGDILPGEVYIKSDKASVYLKNDGTVSITGNVKIEGRLFVNGTEIE